MSSNIEIPKTCIFCGKVYTARQLHTQYCSHRCNQLHYKEKKRQEKIQAAMHPTAMVTVPIRDTAANGKDFFTITESARLLGISDRTVFRLIAKYEIKPVKFGRRVVIPKSELLNR